MEQRKNGILSLVKIMMRKTRALRWSSYLFLAVVLMIHNYETISRFRDFNSTLQVLDCAPYTTIALVLGMMVSFFSLGTDTISLQSLPWLPKTNKVSYYVNWISQVLNIVLLSLAGLLCFYLNKGLIMSAFRYKKVVIKSVEGMVVVKGFVWYVLLGVTVFSFIYLLYLLARRFPKSFAATISLGLAVTLHGICYEWLDKLLLWFVSIWPNEMNYSSVIMLLIVLSALFGGIGFWINCNISVKNVELVKDKRRIDVVWTICCILIIFLVSSYIFSYDDEDQFDFDTREVCDEYRYVGELPVESEDYKVVLGNSISQCVLLYEHDRDLKQVQVDSKLSNQLTNRSIVFHLTELDGDLSRQALKSLGWKLHTELKGNVVHVTQTFEKNTVFILPSYKNIYFLDPTSDVGEYLSADRYYYDYSAVDFDAEMISSLPVLEDADENY